MRQSCISAACLCIIGWAALGYGQLQSFRIRFVNTDVVYIEGGTAAGLKEGMRLSVKRPGPGESPLLAPVLAELVVLSVATTSAACEIARTDVAIEAGDFVFISSTDLAAPTDGTSELQPYAQIVEFSGADPVDPLEQELRDNVPKPPLREVNHFGGRIGFDQDAIIDRSGAGLNSHQQGVTFRFDFTRIGDSFWSIDGYWRARISARNGANDLQDFTDVLQRVYQFGLRYSNPNSRYVAGVGRLLVPWASSLSTLDGAYFGRRLGRNLTIGGFGGSTPDPAAWNYDPNSQVGGVFVNAEAGNFDRVRQSLTVGVALSRLHWKPERQFLFVENGTLIGRRISLHHNMEVDYQSPGRFASTQSVSLSRSFLTLRVQPVSPITLDLSHNYFRVLPTADSRLAATGRLDNLLFQGLNGGVRFDLPMGLALYGTLGRSERSEDSAPSWNRMGGVTSRIPGLNLRADVRYSRFAGTVASGDYRSASLRRDGSNRWRLEIEGGDQRLDSPFAGRSKSWYATGNINIFVQRFVLDFRATRYQSESQRYDQFRAGLDYRF